MSEQERLSEQLEETRELAATRQERLRTLESEMKPALQQRDVLGIELDERLSTYISDSAAELQRLAEERGSLDQQIKRLKDYLELYAKRDAIVIRQSAIEEREAELLSQLEDAKAKRADVEERIRVLEKHFTRYLREMALPEFLSKPEGTINRQTYLPMVNGRAFEELQSEGLSIEVNVAHALAHHATALELGLVLPGILMIDGASGGFGDAGLDPKRVEAIYGQIVQTCHEADGRLQVIAVDTKLPNVAEGHVVLELSESNRLVPKEDLDRLLGDSIHHST
jgi:hypothetical protein